MHHDKKNLPSSLWIIKKSQVESADQILGEKKTIFNSIFETSASESLPVAEARASTLAVMTEQVAEQKILSSEEQLVPNSPHPLIMQMQVFLKLLSLNYTMLAENMP